jgi:hypothetical protein
METMDKQEKIDIVNEALKVLYRELNDYSVHSDFPAQEVPYIVESILKLEKLLTFFGNENLDLIKYFKGELKEND